MKLTGSHQYISPLEQYKHVVDALVQRNCVQYDKLLLPPEKSWTVDEEVYKELRRRSEEQALFLMRRTLQFAKHRTQKEEETVNPRKKPLVIKVKDEDLNNAWTSLQMEKN